MMKPLLLIALLISLAIAEDLHGWKVIQAEIKSNEQLVALKNWDFDVWSHDSNLVLGTNDIRVNEEHLEGLKKLGIHYSVIVDDVQVMLDEMAEDAVNETAASWFDSYHSLDEFTVYLTNFSTSFPALVKKSTIGTSVQGRNIDAYVVTGTATGTKKKIVFTGMQHAREWISPHTVAYVFTQLVSLYATDTSVRAILDRIQFHIIPIVNPDGYLYTWGGSSQRLWRKNRRLNTGGSYGVDLNRNWNDHWGGDGASRTPTSDTYCGTAPFSEPETKSVGDYILNNRPFNGDIDFHSYGQLVLRPYGWTTALPPDAAVQKFVGDDMSAQIRANGGKVYTSEPSHTLYYTTGSADDWGYTQAGIKLSYTIELRDTTTFQLPANQIIPTGIEIWAAMKSFSNYIINNN